MNKNLLAQMTIVGMVMVFIAAFVYYAGGFPQLLADAINSANLTGGDKTLALLIPTLIPIVIILSLIVYVVPRRNDYGPGY